MRCEPGGRSISWKRMPRGDVIHTFTRDSEQQQEERERGSSIALASGRTMERADGGRVRKKRGAKRKKIKKRKKGGKRQRERERLALLICDFFCPLLLCLNLSYIVYCDFRHSSAVIHCFFTPCSPVSPVHPKQVCKK